MSNDTDPSTDQTQYRTTPVTEQELRDAVRRHTPAGTAEIADVLGVSRQAVDYRLRRLEAADGPIWSKKVGPTRVWMHNRLLKRGLRRD